MSELSVKANLIIAKYGIRFLHVNKSDKMDNKPTLSQYFGGSEVPPASQFFDEIGTSPSEMIQSIYLGESEGKK